jgi:hypothetical protein
VTSDFSAARAHLDRAAHYLRGNDDVSRKVREAIDLLLEEVIGAEHLPPSAKVLDFRRVELGRRHASD